MDRAITVAHKFSDRPQDIQAPHCQPTAHLIDSSTIQQILDCHTYKERNHRRHLYRQEDKPLPGTH